MSLFCDLVATVKTEIAEKRFIILPLKMQDGNIYCNCLAYKIQTVNPENPYSQPISFKCLPFIFPCVNYNK